MLIDTITKGILAKQGQNILRIDLSTMHNSVCNDFVICHADSTRQVGAIADSVQENVKNNLKENVVHMQGSNNAQWIILDYFNIIVHIFQKESRDYYKLEDLWADGKITKIEE